MAVVVRAYEHGGTLSLIREALNVDAAGSDEEGGAGGDAQVLEEQDEAQDGPYVVVGDEIRVDEQEGYLRGHGTQVVDGKLRATVCGILEHVNKLVYVRPLKTR